VKDSDPSFVWKSKDFNPDINRRLTANEYSSDKMARILKQIDELRVECVYNKTPSFGGELNEFLNSPLTEEELLFVIRNLKVKSSPRLDVSIMSLPSNCLLWVDVYFFAFPTPFLLVDLSRQVRCSNLPKVPNHVYT